MIQILQDRFFCQLQDIYQPLLLGELRLLDEGLNCQVQKGEYYVDQRHSGLKKVIIIPGDELAQLIDECAKSQASDHRHQIVG